MRKFVKISNYCINTDDLLYIGIKSNEIVVQYKNMNCLILNTDKYLNSKEIEELQNYIILNNYVKG